MSPISYAPSEAAIEAAIERRIGSAGFFQRVAEQLARGIYPVLSTNLVPFGRRTDDKTSAGWPDAYLTNSSGALIAIEATTAENARTGHWPKDLSKLEIRLAPERRGGLIWVAWSDTPSPTAAVEMHDVACRLGLPSEDVHILFRKDVCTRLRAPFHARFWANDLSLRVTSEPFSRVRDVIRRTNLRREIGIFPTIEEYESDLVYSPPVVTQIDNVLVQQHAVVVVGHGAAGKTTVAMLLSYRPNFSNAPAYYLDLTASAADPTLAERAGESIAAVADHGVLFILDNAHLDPEVAVRIYDYWTNSGNGSMLLVLTRRVRPRTEPWTSEPDLEAISVVRFELLIEPSDLEGVFRRLYRAKRGSDARPVHPTILAQWHRLFGGDLLAFSAAVLGLLGRSGELTTLQAADARAYVRDRYIADRDLTREVSALLDLAAVAEVEGLLPIEAFAEDALKRCIRHGLVWIESRGRNRTYRLYRLAHPGLGTLLPVAAGRAATSRIDRCRVLRAHPFVCTAISISLQDNGDADEASALLDALWRGTGWPLADMSLSHWPSAVRISRDLQVLTADDLNERAGTWLAQRCARAKLVEAAFKAPLSHHARCLAYLQREMPEVYKTLREEIAADKNRAALIERALTTLLGGLASFLVYAQTEAPEIETALRDELVAEKNWAVLVSQALATPLDGNILFLEYARQQMPEIAKALGNELVAEKNRFALVERALATPLGHLVSFLVYAHPEMRGVAKILHDELSVENNRSALVKQALVTPLDQLASFLAYARTEMPDVAMAVRDALAKVPDEVVRRALAMPLDHLPSFLTYACAAMPEIAKALGNELVAEKNRFALVERALATPLGHLVSFLVYARTKMPDVAMAVRDALAKVPDEVVRRALATPLDHLASFLTYASVAMPEVAKVIRAGLLIDTNQATLAGHYVMVGPEKIPSICSVDTAFVEILSAVDAASWITRWDNRRLGQPNWFARFAFYCHRAGRRDLVGPIANAIIHTATDEDFPFPGITLLHLASIVTSPHACTPVEVADFFSRCLPSQWLAAQYRSPDASAGALSSAIWRIVTDARVWLTQHFHHAALPERVRAELPTSRHSPRHLAEWLQFFGAARLLDRRVSSVRLFTLTQLSQALEIFPPGLPDQGIQTIQARLWAGLREWCHISRAEPVADAVLAEGILAQFQVADPVDRPRLAAFNSVMIDWLERCEQQNWRLIAEPEPLLEALERHIRVQAKI
jgi:hypothetical protein